MSCSQVYAGTRLGTAYLRSCESWAFDNGKLTTCYLGKQAINGGEVIVRV